MSDSRAGTTEPRVPGTLSLWGVGSIFRETGKDFTGSRGEPVAKLLA